MERSNNKSTLTANKKSRESSRLGQSISTADPTPPPPTEVDVNKFISAQDLKSLKEQDPFLYYSIPGVREATIRLGDDEVDIHQVALNSLRRGEGSPATASRTRTSETVKVKRCKRHTFECHTDLLLEDLGLEELSGGLNLGEFDDIISWLY